MDAINEAFRNHEEDLGVPVYDADLSVLSERNREILRLRFEEKLTLEAIGKQYGIGGERVRQIVIESFMKMHWSQRRRDPA